MRKLALAVVSFVVAWLAASVVLALVFGLVVNPLPWLVYQVSGPMTISTYNALTGAEILVATVLLGRLLYRSLVQRWGGERISGAPEVGSLE